MGRLKKRKFANFNEFIDYQHDNAIEIQSEVLDKLEAYYGKHNKIGMVDVFNVELDYIEDLREDYPGIENPFKMTIFEAEWSDALSIALKNFLSKERYELASRIKKLQDKIENDKRGKV